LILNSRNNTPHPFGLILIFILICENGAKEEIDHALIASAWIKAVNPALKKRGTLNERSKRGELLWGNPNAYKAYPEWG
jgi:hypothetical protein